MSTDTAGRHRLWRHRMNIDAGEASWLKTILGPLSAYVPKVESELVNQSTSIVHSVAANPPASACT